MQQLEFFDIPSPCIGVCQSGDKGYCIGCFRTREERLYWHQIDADVKRKIIRACQMRKRRAVAGGKAAKGADGTIQQQLEFDEDQP
ncbi:DUF1289 domain-containing protein [Bowmanella pacifica]|uniref:DUF1289 domain-containing protein n=1 Tax=Bowmanella pacifica TaxID=502051 RepID=A0A917YZH7_9ALTE|nr:DUF1289 domain-containing protein [Bowmanella pacifica]GGO68761.1 hypothetical protein GCM10010982_18430 [Bowmanella pacifica]